MASTRTNARDTVYGATPSSVLIPVPAKDLKSVSAELFHNPEYSDITVQCKGRSWRCHRNILCPRCHFFKAACDGGYIESQSLEIKVDDDAPEAVEMLLLYFYTLEPPVFGNTFNDKAWQAFVIADKYEAEGLKEAAKLWFTDKMENSLSRFDSLSDVVKEAWIGFITSFYEIDVPGVKALRSTAVRNMVPFAKELMALAAGKQLLEHNSEFLYDLLSGMALKIAKPVR